MPKFELPDIYFVRHGQTSWNAESRYQGQRDIPLNETGQGQADMNGPVLKELLVRDNRAPKDLDWYCSPLSRTRETMQRVRAAFDPQTLPEVTFDDRLKEISFGDFEGALLTELGDIGGKAPGERTESFWTFRPPNGENYEDVEQRVSPFLEAIKGPSVIVAHGGIARLFRHLLTDDSQLDVINWAVPQTVVMRFSKGEMTLFESGFEG